MFVKNLSASDSQLYNGDDNSLLHVCPKYSFLLWNTAGKSWSYHKAVCPGQGCLILYDTLFLSKCQICPLAGKDWMCLPVSGCLFLVWKLIFNIWPWAMEYKMVFLRPFINSSDHLLSPTTVAVPDFQLRSEEPLSFQMLLILSQIPGWEL